MRLLAVIEGLALIASSLVYMGLGGAFVFVLMLGGTGSSDPVKSFFIPAVIFCLGLVCLFLAMKLFTRPDRTTMGIGGVLIAIALSLAIFRLVRGPL